MALNTEKLYITKQALSNLAKGILNIADAKFALKSALETKSNINHTHEEFDSLQELIDEINGYIGNMDELESADDLVSAINDLANRSVVVPYEEDEIYPMGLIVITDDAEFYLTSQETVLSFDKLPVGEGAIELAEDTTDLNLGNWLTARDAYGNPLVVGKYYKLPRVDTNVYIKITNDLLPLTGSLGKKVNDLEEEVYQLSARYSSNNAKVYEVGTKVTPTATIRATYRGEDVTSELSYILPSGTIRTGNTWKADHTISSGTRTYNTTVKYGDKSVTLEPLTYSFSNYRYAGSVPTINPALKSLNLRGLISGEWIWSRGLSTSYDFTATNIQPEDFYVFAVKGDFELICRDLYTGAIIEGCKTGTEEIPLENDSSILNTYTYIKIPACEELRSYKITKACDELPKEYIKDASVSSNTLTLTKNNGNKVTFTPVNEVASIVVKTQTDYDALVAAGTIDANTLYLIKNA